MLQFRRIALGFVGAFILFNGCGGSDVPTVPVTPVDTTTKVPPPPPPPVVAAVQVTAPATLTVGRTGTVTASARTSQNAEVTGKTFAFSSNNAAAVTVSASGTLTAVGPGTAVISASVDGITGTATVVSTDASLFSLTISPTSRTMYVTNTQAFTISGKDSSGAAVAIRFTTWKSSNPNVAIVSNTGLVTAIGLGSTIISVEGITNSAANASATVTVIPVPVSNIFIAPIDTILRFRTLKQLVVSARDSANNVLTGRSITFATSNVDVAAVDPLGGVTANGVGSVTVTASSEGKSAAVRLYVVPDSGAFLVVAGGTPGDSVYAGIDIPNAGSVALAYGIIPTDDATRVTIVAGNGTYRARAASVATARLGANLRGVAVQLGLSPSTLPLTLGPPSTVFPIQLKPYTATINAPATASVSAPVTVTWTFDESTQPFTFFPARSPGGWLYYSTTNGDDLAGTQVAATVTQDLTTGLYTFSATFVPPSTGPLYIQVAGEGALATLLSPIKAQGQAYKIITVQ